jgi:hypothetical protein
MKTRVFMRYDIIFMRIIIIVQRALKCWKLSEPIFMKFNSRAFYKTWQDISILVEIDRK